MVSDVSAHPRLLLTRMVPQWSRVGVAAAAVVIDLALWGGTTQLRTGGSMPPWVVVAIAVVAYTTLAVGDRYPLLTFGVLWTFSLVGTVLPSYEAFVGMLAAVYALARHSARQVAVMGLLLCLIPVGINVVNAWSFQPEPSLIGSMIIATLWLLLFVIVWGVGRTARRSAIRSRDHSTALARATAEAQRIERVRIARELHDSVAHTLSAVVLQAAGARAVCQRGIAPLPTVTDALEAIERSGSQAMRELHRLLGLLREGESTADGSDVASVSHSLDELSELIDTTRASGLAVTLTEQGTPGMLDPSVAHAAYRFAQETLANAMRHAGAGGSMNLRLRWLDDCLVVTATSVDGPEAPALPIRGGHGLAGLDERVRLLGGRLEAHPTRDGFLTEARLPVARRAVNSTRRER